MRDGCEVQWPIGRQYRPGSKISSRHCFLLLTFRGITEEGGQATYPALCEPTWGSGVLAAEGAAMDIDTTGVGDGGPM